MILEPISDAHMFLRGFRAPASGTDNVNPVGEEVGVFIARQVFGVDGQPRAPGKVLDTDQPFDPAKPEGPFRFESELATTKPELDVVIVDNLGNFLSGPEIADANVADIIVTKIFGDVRIDSGAGFGPLIGRHLGWWPRGSDPRKGLAGRETGPAGDPTALESFDAHQFKLPAMYFNAFNAGNSVPGQPPLVTGNRLRFEPGMGTAFEAAIPAGPVLAVSQDGEPLDPPLNLSPRVDTIVLDRADASLTFVWRAVFPWQARYETATLEVS